MPAVQLKDYCFAHQPILGPDNRIVAMELLYRDPQPRPGDAFDHTAATANVIINAFSHLGMIELTGRRKLFINVAEDLLLSDTITLLPRDKVTLELLEHIEADAAILARVRQLKHMGYTFALDDYVLHAETSPLLELVDIIKVDILQAEPGQLPRLVAYLRQWPCLLLAEKIENGEIHEACVAAGFDLFQGYFYARPALLGGRLADPSKLVVLDLLSKVSDDADLGEIEAAFKGNPGLTYSLLRLLNSPAFYSARRIDSIRQAIQVVGLRQLAKWLQMLLFTQQGEQQCSPLLELAVHRGRLMELAAGAADLPPERAHMTGMLSLADGALGIPLAQIIANLNLALPVRQALLAREGRIGTLLSLCERLEHGDFEAVARLAETLGIRLAALMEMQKESIAWSNRMLHALHQPAAQG